jgi:tRNA(Ile)-lysidine synthetase-like protein
MSATGASRPLSRCVRPALAEAGIGRGSVVLAGVSGGPDSTALLSVLASLAADLGFSLLACHVDHGIRPAAEREADLASVRDLCAGLGVPLDVRSVPEGGCAREASEGGRSLEEVARRRRLALLAEAADAARAGFIALGHTRDDHRETVLMRALQGAGPRGLAGIAPRRGRFVRPLLGASRAEVMAHLAAEGLSARTDPSNADTRFLRNRVRRLLVPVLSRAVPGWGTAVSELARGMARVASFLDEEAARLPWKRRGTGWSIDRRAFFAAHPALRVHSLLHLADRVPRGSLPARLPHRFLEPALGADPGPGRRFLIRGHGLALQIDRADLFWGPDIVSPSEKGYLHSVPREGILFIEGTGASVAFRRGPDPGPGETAIPVREVVPPLVLRSRRKGDRIDGPTGSATLKSLCGVWGVSRALASMVPVLADRRGVLAILGTAVGGRTATRCAGLLPGEECLLVRVTGGAKERKA